MKGTIHVLVLVLSAIVLEINFLGDFSQPLVTGELLDFDKKKGKIAKSYGGRNSLTLRSVLILDRAWKKKTKKKLKKIREA